MKRDNDRQTAIILSIVGIVPVIWLALLIAPSISGGLPEIAANLATLFDNPFSIKLCGDSLKTVRCCMHNISRTLHNLRQCVLSSVQCSDIHTADKFLFLFLVIIGSAYQFCVDIS